MLLAVVPRRAGGVGTEGIGLLEQDVPGRGGLGGVNCGLRHQKDVGMKIPTSVIACPRFNDHRASRSDEPSIVAGTGFEPVASGL